MLLIKLGLGLSFITFLEFMMFGNSFLRHYGFILVAILSLFLGYYDKGVGK